LEYRDRPDALAPLKWHVHLSLTGPELRRCAVQIIEGRSMI
jgi:hypothetical protein